MSTKFDNTIQSLKSVSLESLSVAVGGLRSIFDNDQSKIVSNSGQEILDSKDDMIEVEKQLAELQSSGKPFRGIVID